MAKCDVCGKDESMPYNCRHCGGTYCGEHRLPENHNCTGLQNWNDPSGVFDSGFDDSVNDTGTSKASSISSKLPFDTGTGGPLAYFRGNATYLFLMLMWATFLLQFVTRLVLTPAGSLNMTFESYQTWRSIFVLTPTNPEYVWTWFTSIFSHGGLMHIAFNSIVIFFFGPLVERYAGSRNFGILFLVSGALAGLSQVGISIFQGDVGPLASGVLGASGAALAIMGVLTVLNPNLKVYLYFILPVPLWLLTVGTALVSLAFIGGGAAGGGGIAHAAHLVGLLVGLAYGEYIRRTRNVRTPNQFQLGGGPGGPGGPGRGRGPF